MIDSISKSSGASERQVSGKITRPIPPFQLSFYFRLTLLPFSVMAFICVSWIVLVRQDVSPSNPFSAYSSFFPGQKWNAEIAKGFTCPQIDVVEGRNYCIFSPTGGSFEIIYLYVSKGTVDSITFVARVGALNIGDLALLWGTPTKQLFQRSALFIWPSMQTSADGLSLTWGFSYYFPVTHITFAGHKIESGNPVAGHRH